MAKGGPRDKAQIATKVGLAWKDSEVYRDSRRALVSQEIEDSLRRLRTDVIDLYQVHWPNLETPIEETARALDDLRRQGKTRAVGVSNYSSAQMDAFQAVATLDAVQPPYQLDPVDEVAGWQIDERTKADIDAILGRCITDPVSPDFMAPPEKSPLRPA